jgi:glutathione S-transferase
MILIGQYDSSFVRRIGIALRIYGIPFEHRPWSTFSDVEKIRSYNPLTRVPTLVLDDGAVLFDSTSIIDYIDSLVEPEFQLYPTAQPERYQAMAVTTLAAGVADKTASLFYELRLHDKVSPAWVARCRGQILAAMAVLEKDKATRPGEFWFGNRIGHADIAVTTSLRHMQESHPDLASMSDYPALRDHCTHFEAQPLFKEISQPFIPPT